jgi:hypothetical protein
MSKKSTNRTVFLIRKENLPADENVIARLESNSVNEVDSWLISHDLLVDLKYLNECIKGDFYSINFFKGE